MTARSITKQASRFDPAAVARRLLRVAAFVQRSRQVSAGSPYSGIPSGARAGGFLLVA